MVKGTCDHFWVGSSNFNLPIFDKTPVLSRQPDHNTTSIKQCTWKINIKPTSKNVCTSNQQRKFLNTNKDTCKGISNKGRHKNIVICVAALGLPVWGVGGGGGGGEREREKQKGFQAFLSIFCICAPSALLGKNYVHVRSPDLFLYWARKCPKNRPCS